MSWPQRPEPPPRGYPVRNAAQGYGTQQNMYPNYQNPQPNNTQPQQQYWQQTQPSQQPQYNQQYTAGQLYQQDYAANNTNQAYPQYNQSYTNQSYHPHQQQTPQQNYYSNQQTQQQQNNYGAKQTKDGWDDGWEWGWDEAKQAQNQVPTQQQYQQPNPVPQATPQPLAYNNANVIEESFSASDSWNWSVDETPKNADQPAPVVQQQPLELLSKSTLDSSTQNIPDVPHTGTEEVKSLCDQDVREKLPNLALGKRFHLENLTPQWSIESQMSQDSSDGVQTHSESTYQSESQSRNSTSSPGYNAENNNYSHVEDPPHNMDWPQHISEPPKLDGTSEDIVRSMHDMRIGNGKNNIVNLNQRNEIKGTVADAPPPPPSSIASFPSSSLPPSMSPSLPQIPPTHSMPVQLTSSAANLVAPPPIGNIPTSTNPFKNTRPLAHKHVANVPSSSMAPVNFSTASRDIPASTSLVSPMAVNMMQQARPSLGFGANLETTPDNSERPDPIAQFRPSPLPRPLPDNLEVAPRSDRNEYLQTAHLSSADYVENTDFSRNAAPPPGLRRMVVGQQEGEYQHLNLSGDEPPPGLARMVPGQQNESDNIYNQQSDDYLDRQIDGWTDNSSRPYNQADGQQLQDFNQVPNRTTRSLDMDRMVPGEPSSDNLAQYSNQSYAVNEERVVTGVDHDYNAPADVREVNMDGSDYTEPRVNQTTNDTAADFNTEDQQREVTVEGENLEDLSLVSSVDVSFSRDQTLDGADLTLDINADRRTDVSDSMDAQASGSRRHSLTRNTSGDDSERDRAFKASPRREKHKRDRDRDKEKEDKYRDGKDKGERRSDRRSDRDKRERDKDRDRPRKEKEVSPDDRRHRRSTRSRKYETEDTDYYSDRERDKRRYREGSYTASSKPPRPDDKERRHDRDRTRRYATIERDRRLDDERDGVTRSRRGERDRHERRYRDIDPSRRHGNLRREDDERRRGEAYTSPSRSAAPTDEDAPQRADRDDRRRRRHRHDDYYDESAVDAYSAQRAQYEYYERLRRSDPAAYMRLYRQLMAGEQPGVGYTAFGYEPRGEERGSVHSGRSSANGYAANVTWYRGGRTDYRDETLRDNASYRTDYSDRDITTDASLNLQLDDSTMRSDRMTPLKFATSHCKGSVSAAGQVVMVEEGAVRLVPLASCLPPHFHYPSPFIPGVTHKKSVMSLCQRMSARASSSAERRRVDSRGAALLWDLLNALIDHNGVLVGTDIAEILMRDVKDTQPTDQAPPRGSANSAGSLPAGSRRDSSTSGSARDTSPAAPHSTERSHVEPTMDNNDPAVLEKFREYLIYGNKEQALEWAMSHGLWAHALVASAGSGRVAARFLSALTPRDPLRSLYAGCRGSVGTLALTLTDCGDVWRSHVAIIIANSTLSPLHNQNAQTNAKAENDRKIIINIGDSLASKGLIYSAQFCYLIAGVEFAQHPLAPLSPPPPSNEVPRLSLLLSPPAACSWQQLASEEAVCASEVYEYGRALHSHYALPHLQVYKFIMATRLVDAGECTRALAYCEQIAKVVAASPQDYSPALVTQLAALADRLQYLDGSMSEEGGVLEGADSLPPASPRTDWLRDLISRAQQAKLQRQMQTSQPLEPTLPTPPAHDSYTWHEQQTHYMQPSYPPPQAEGVAEPQAHEEPPQFYQPPPPPQHSTMPSVEPQQPLQQQPPPAPAYNSYSEEWTHAAAAEDTNHSYGDNYWPDYSGYGNEEPRAQITMPGASRTQRPSVHDQESDRETETSSKSARTDDKPSKETSKAAAEKAAAGAKSGWLGGILNKLSLRPPNQMILPDDKNPTIVWDESTKRWRNTDGEEHTDAPPPPPPTTQDLRARHNIGSPSPPLSGGPPLPQSGAPPPLGAPVANIFKMQKARHIKKSYVDVLNPGGLSRTSEVPAPLSAPLSTPLAAAAPNYFIPAPTNAHQAQGDFSYEQQQSNEQWSQ